MGPVALNQSEKEMREAAEWEQSGERSAPPPPPDHDHNGCPRTWIWIFIQFNAGSCSQAAETLLFRAECARQRSRDH